MERAPTPSAPKFEHLAAQIAELANAQHDGRGVEFLRWVIDDLRAGDLERAKANLANQSDKLAQYPKIKELLKEEGLIEEIDWNNE